MGALRNTSHGLTISPSGLRRVAFVRWLGAHESMSVAMPWKYWAESPRDSTSIRSS